MTDSSNKENNQNSKSKNIIVNEVDLLKKASKTKILEFVKVIWRHKNSADQIKELKNGYFASFGTDNRLYIYDKNFNFTLKSEDLNDWVYHILEITSQDKIGKEIQIILCTNKFLYLLQISIEKNSSRIQKYDYGGLICLEIKKNNYVICGTEGADHFSDLFSKIIQSKKNKLFTESYRGGLVLSQNLVAFSSNKIMPGGEDKLKFYNPNAKKIIKEIPKDEKNEEGFSNILSSNGLYLLESENKEFYKIFLAANRKYTKTQNNQITIVVSFFEENDSMEISSFKTGSFEVHCFCQISIIKNENLKKENILGNDNSEVEAHKTDYFFVGGFDLESRCGLIKLFKANFSEKLKETKIEFIQDIEIDKPIPKNNNFENQKNRYQNGSKIDTYTSIKDSTQNNLKSSDIKRTLMEGNSFDGFHGPITSIIQSSRTGNILATCYDGKVYLLTPPNIEYYLLNENKDKEYLN